MKYLLYFNTYIYLHLNQQLAFSHYPGLKFAMQIATTESMGKLGPKFASKVRSRGD